MVKDFLEWCVHNLLHRVSWLWTLHKLHHSIVEMDFIGNFRFHWMEILVYDGLKWLPLAALGADPAALLAVGAISTAVGHLNHANLRIAWGPLRYVLNSPRMHVWHHDYELHGRCGQNFGVVFSVWDWVFRTSGFAHSDPASSRCTSRMQPIGLPAALCTRKSGNSWKEISTGRR